MGNVRACFCLLILLLLAGEADAQAYFKILEQPGKSYNKKIAHFANGDLLVADSPLDALAPGENRSLVLQRLDPCGNIVWARRYVWADNYLEFKDLQISPSDEIYLYGSAYRVFDEWIFLLKLTEAGDLLKFRLFNGGTVDHFTFSIDLQQNRLLAYGLLLDWNSQKQGFVAVFNPDLVFQWGRKFAPFESFGDAIMTRDRGFLCRSGSFLYKLDPAGALQWAYTLETATGAYPVAGPLELSDGYVFELYHDGYGSFYKIDPGGQLLWQSAKFPSTKHPANFLLQPDGQILAAWNMPGAGADFPSLLQLSPNGQILQQRQLSVDLPINSGLLDLALGEDRQARLVGSTDPFSYAPDKVSDFLMQFQPDSLSGACFHWKPLQAQVPNDIPLTLTPLDTTILVQTMTEVPAGGLLVLPQEVSVREFCDPLPALTVIPVDTTLPCDAVWSVALPGPDFRWDDDSPANPRLLRQAGTVRASNRQCDHQITYAFTLHKQHCACPVYLPNAFRPGTAGENGVLEFFCTCSLQRVELALYDRWGDKVFESTAPGQFWDGTFQHRAAPAGVYLAKMRYQALDNAGVLQEGELVQDVTLLR